MYEKTMKVKKPWLTLRFPQDEAFSDTLYEQEVVEKMKEWIKPGMRVLDVGAHCGFYTTLFSSLGAMVQAFEPLPDNFQILSHNAHEAAAIYVKEIILHQYALGNEDGIRKLRYWKGEKASGRAQFVEGDAAEVEIDVSIKKLDSIASWAFDRLDFIKIDVEHWEFEVIKGAQETINKYRPVIFVETHDEKWASAIRDWAVENKYTATHMKSGIPKLAHSADYLHLVPMSL